MNLFGNIKKLLHKRSRVEIEILQDIDLDHMFTNPKVADEIRGRVQETISKKNGLLPKYEEATNELALVQRIDTLPKEELNDLEAIAKRYSEALMEKDSFQKVMQNESNVSKYLERYKDEIESAIKELEEHEKKQAIIKNDLYMLEGEKGDIKYRNNRGNVALSFLKMLLIFMLLGSAIAALIMTTLFFVYKVDVFIPAVIIVVVVSFVVLWIYIFRRYLIHDLKRNQKLQKRQVELANKTKIKYINVQQFLDYSYKKYQVNSSEMLQLRWENYQRFTKNEAKLKRISTNAASMMHDSDRILIRNNIEAGSYVTDHIDYFTSKKGRKLLQNSIEVEKQNLKEAIDQCDSDVLVLSRLLEEITDH